MWIVHWNTRGRKRVQRLFTRAQLDPITFAKWDSSRTHSINDLRVLGCAGQTLTTQFNEALNAACVRGKTTFYKWKSSDAHIFAFQCEQCIGMCSICTASPITLFDLSSDGLGQMTIFGFVMRSNSQTVAFSFANLWEKENYKKCSLEKH